MSYIVTIDDDADLRNETEMLLTGAGHQIALAANREDGLKLVMDTSPDLTILDVMMDDIDDGFVLARELRRRGYDNPILMVTKMKQYVGMQYGRDCEWLPVDEFLEKPVTSEHLLRAVGRLLNGQPA